MNTYKKIWASPSETIDYILLNGFNPKFINLNFLIAGLVTILPIFGRRKVFEAFGFFGGLSLLIPLTLFAWLLLKYGLPFIYFMIGKIWKGKATLKQISLIMSLSLIPEIIYLIYIICVGAHKGELVEVNYLIWLVGFIFSLRILVIGLSKVQGFSFGLTLMNLFLPIVIFSIVGLLAASF